MRLVCFTRYPPNLEEDVPCVSPDGREIYAGALVRKRIRFTFASYLFIARFMYARQYIYIYMVFIACVCVRVNLKFTRATSETLQISNYRTLTERPSIAACLRRRLGLKTRTKQTSDFLVEMVILHFAFEINRPLSFSSAFDFQHLFNFFSLKLYYIFLYTKTILYAQ